MDRVELLRPGWLWAGLALLPWLFYGSYVTLVDFGRTQRRLSLFVRALIVLLLAAAAAQLTWYRPAVERYVVLAVDRSDSVGPAGKQRADELIDAFRQAARSNRVALVEFASQPGHVRELTSEQDGVETPTDADSLNQTDGTDGTDGTGTDLASAIEVARAAIPPGHVPHVVLVSDGQQNRGDVIRVAAASHIPVSTIALPASQQPEVQLSDVRVPSQVQVGEPFYVEVVISANRASSAELELYRDDLRVDLGDSSSLVLNRGDNSVRLRQQIEQPQSSVYTARIRASRDTRLDNNQASAHVMVTGSPRILMVDRQPASLDPLRWALEDQQFTVDLIPPNGVPASLAGLMEYDAIVLSDVPASALPPVQQQALRQYVEQLGGGLLMLGGEQSFGLGGYYKTPLEAVLPVRSDFEQEREKPSLAMVLVIDRSGSMGGVKLDLAKDAARGTVELLGPRDQVGVVAFDDDAYWVSPLRSAADRGTSIDNINRLSSAGGTNLYPALAQAHSALQHAAAKLKHVIVLSDGISAPADFDRLIGQMVADRIVVSAVAVGDKADRRLLESIAQQGEGRYYECSDPRSVPQIFAQETMMASKSAIEEQPFLPQLVRATSVLRGIDLSTAPPLLGYVVTRPKATSEVILASEKGDPILAWWRYGLGSSLAFTSDAKSRWGVEWLTWPDFSAFWAQCVRHVMRRTRLDAGQLQVSRHDGTTRVTLDLVDNNEAFINLAQTRLSVLTPDDKRSPREYLMHQSAPGRYEAQFTSDRPGSYLLDVVSRSDARVLFRQTLGVHVGYADELRLRPVNTRLLARIAQQTGGMVNPSPADVFAAPATSGRHAVPLWRALVTLATVLWVLDVALRRLLIE